MKAEELLDAALSQIESESIRSWVSRQRNVWERLGARPLLDKYGADEPLIVTRMVSLILIEAIGL